MPERLEDIIRGKQRIWFTVSWWEMGEWPAYARLMLNWLDHHAVRELRVPFDDITLYRYRLLENGDATVPVERLADYGDATLPAYGRVQAADAVDWRDSFEAAARFLEETPPAVVGLSADTDTRPATIAVANETNDFQALTCSAFLSAETFTAAAFRRLLPKEESWRPINTWEMNCGDALDEQAMAVFFEPDDPEQCSVFAESDLPQGQYAVMARMLVGGDTATQASLRFEAASLMHMQVQAGVGAFTPHADNSPLRWEWVHIGNMTSFGGPFRLLVTAERPAQRDYASASFSRIVVLANDSDTPPNIAPVQQWNIELHPHEKSRFTLPEAVQTGLSQRVDIILTNQGGQYLRSIWFYTPQQ